MSDTTFHNMPIWSRFDHFDIKARTILLGYVGSYAYGTNTDNSDHDFLGVFVAPEKMYYGLDRMEEWRLENFDDGKGMVWDGTIYEIRKIMRLWLNNNPHTLQLFGLSDHYYIHIEPEGRLLLENKKLFYSKKIYKSFIGYSHAQMGLMKRQAGGQNYETGRLGAKRKAVIEKYGFDVKAGSQMIRLLRTCIEFLVTGEMNVWRAEHRELKAIKQGEWSLERIEAEAQRLFILADEAYVKTSLPNEPDYAKIDELLCHMTKAYLKQNG